MSVTIRAAVAADLPAIAELAGSLVRLHHELDAARFMLISNVAPGYARFFASELNDPDAFICQALLDSECVGYAYARLEPRNWNDLLDACGVLQDLFVSENARRRGIAKQLVAAVQHWLRERGAPRLVLHTASRNASARAFFAELGFRETMVEFTQEL